MKNQLKTPVIPFENRNMFKGIITEINEDGTIIVAGNGTEPVPCYVLKTSKSTNEYNVGDRVIYIAPDDYETDMTGCILGHIEPYKHKKDKVGNMIKQNGGRPALTSVEDEMIHIKAEKGLVIECGKGSITITKEGKIKISGTDLVSRAKGLSRIKGAAVKIN